MGVEIVVSGSPAWSDLRAEFVEAQAGQCAICAAELGAKAQLDHCHTTGCIRGALCTGCNVMLGWYEANRRGIETYLARAYEFEAHRIAPRLSKGERLRKYWQDKEIR
jgi:hypothetical protein